MYVRAVRFTDVDAQRMETMLARINQDDERPEGVNFARLQVLSDAGSRTAVVLQYFRSAEDMEAGARVLSAMDSSQTPGTRASVDECELKLELEA